MKTLTIPVPQVPNSSVTDFFDIYDGYNYDDGFLIVPFSDAEAFVTAIRNGDTYIVLLERDFLHLKSLAQVVDAVETYYTTEDIVQVRNLF